MTIVVVVSFMIAVPFSKEMDQFTGPVGLTEAVQTPVRVNVTCVTPLGEEVASTW